MKYLIFSDSHGYPSAMKKAIELNKDALGIFYLGDGVSDIKRISASYPEMKIVSVLGNNDFYIDGSEKFVNTPPLEEYEKTVTVGNVKILLMHGHRRRVKKNLAYALSYAESINADILLFGHTHCTYNKYYPMYSGKGIYAFNPGSIGYVSYGGYFFGVLKIGDNNISLSHGKIEY